jgi:DNA uptake protein ComE-like DNA-binding protein
MADVLMDVDVASAAQLEALPRVGPALAARIVAARDSGGPFGSLEALGRVRGIGPAMLRQLGPLVTFSGRAASSDVRTRYR